MARLMELLTVALLLVFVAIFAWVGYEMHIYMQSLKERGKQEMAKHNVTFNKDGGMKVGVKEVKDEEYRDKTQSFLVNIWNLSSFPAYKSRFWNQQAAINTPVQGTSEGIATGSVSRPNASSRQGSSAPLKPKGPSRDNSAAGKVS